MVFLYNLIKCFFLYTNRQPLVKHMDYSSCLAPDFIKNQMSFIFRFDYKYNFLSFPYQDYPFSFSEIDFASYHLLKVTITSSKYLYDTLLPSENLKSNIAIKSNNWKSGMNACMMHVSSFEQRKICMYVHVYTLVTSLNT